MKFERLGNIVNIKKGKKPNFTENPNSDSVRVLQIDDLRNDNNLKFTNNKSGVFACKEDVLLVWDGANAGTVGHGKEGYIGSTIALLSKKEPEKYSTTFIGLFLQSKFNYLRSKTTGATIPHIDGKVLRDLGIPILPYQTQLHIANILTKAESLIAQRKESISLLDEYLKSVFLEMFGDPLENPKNFEIKTLKDFYINPKEGTKCGPFGSALKKHEYTSSGVPVWNMDNISVDGNFVSNINLFITEEKYSQLSAYSTFDGDIIISRAGTVGKMCVLKSGFDKSIISTNLIRVRLNTKLLLSVHFVSLMKYCKNRMARLRTGSDDTFTHMNTGILDSLKFPVPPLELQTKFAQIVEKTEALKAQYQQSLQGLENLYGSLSQKAFKGELNFKDESLLMAAEPETKYGV